MRCLVFSQPATLAVITFLILGNPAHAQYITPNTIDADMHANQLRYEQEQSAASMQSQMDAMQSQMNQMRDQQDYNADQAAMVEMTRRLQRGS